MIDYVNVRNELTGKVGRIPVRLYNSTAFNKDDVWTLYDGPLDADCGCNGQTVPDEEPEPETFDDAGIPDEEEEV